MTWLLTLFGKAKLYRLAAGAFIAAAFAAYWRIREDGKNAVRLEQQRRNAEAVKDRKEIDDEVADLGSNDVDERFARWMRDDDPR